MSTHTHGRHGRLSKGQKVFTGIGGALLIIATLLAGKGLLAIDPKHDTVHAPFLVDGQANEDLDLRTFQARMLGARYATKLKSGSTTIDTQGIWVIVNMRFTATKEEIALAYAALHDASGRIYLATDRISQPLVDGNRNLQPGIAVEGEIAFEVPRDRIAGMTARFAVKNDPGLQRLETMTDIVLPGSPAVEAAPASVASAQVKP